MSWRAIVRAWCLVSAVALTPSIARAYPQWQLSTGVNRCDQCHLSPSGGGLLSEFGRRIDGDRLSTFAGNGAFLYGAAKLPAWLALGADGSGGLVSQAVQDAGVSAPAYPLAGQAQAAVALGPVSIYGTFGARGQIRFDSADGAARNLQPLADPWLVSSEHWVMWRPENGHPYLRAGRFFAPFGLRLSLDSAFVRRELGFGRLQESYNLSGGYVTDRWELHLTAFAPDFVQHVGSTESGGAVYFERGIGTCGAVALQAKYAMSAGRQRATGGAIGKVYLSKIRTLVFVEADALTLSVDGLANRGQAVGALGVAVLPARGLTITALGEYFQEDVEARAAARGATSLLVGWLPYAHVEAQAVARVELPDGAATTTALLTQLRYWL
jgi:hypothetical protein